MSATLDQAKEDRKHTGDPNMNAVEEPMNRIIPSQSTLRSLDPKELGSTDSLTDTIVISKPAPMNGKLIQKTHRWIR